MEAIVLAGGFGTRLKAVVSDVPKPMAPVAGRPFLEVLLGDMARKGVDRAVLSLGYMADRIIGHFGKSYAGIELDYVVEETPLGTGGGVRLALEHCRSDRAFVLNGDTFLDVDLAAVARHGQLHGLPVIVGREVPDTARYGRLLVQDGRVAGFSEKGMAGNGIINAGCYLFARNQLDAFEAGAAFSLETDFLSPLVSRAPVPLFVTDGHFIDIGVPEDYARAQTELAGRGM